MVDAGQKTPTPMSVFNDRERRISVIAHNIMRLISFLALVGAAILAPVPTQAGYDEVSGSTDDDSGTVSVESSTGPVYGAGRGGGARCSWDLVRINHESDGVRVEIKVAPAETGDPYVQRRADVVYWMYRVECDDGSPVSFRWVQQGVTAADLVPGVTSEASRVVPLPVLDVNPDPAVGGVVNVGLWLAVQEQAVGSVSASAGPDAWIAVSPQLVGTRFDFGNGDVVECDGVGVAIEDVHPDLDVLEESPWCGYTYRVSSPDDEPYELTVTTMWELPYDSSDGGGALPVLERSVTVDYDVDEVQTIGVAN